MRLRGLIGETWLWETLRSSLLITITSGRDSVSEYRALEVFYI